MTDGDRYYPSLVLNDDKFDGAAKSGNWVVPNVEGVDYPIVHNPDTGSGITLPDDSYFYYRDYDTNKFVELSTAGSLGEELLPEGKLDTQADFDYFELSGNPPTFTGNSAACVSLEVSPEHYSRISVARIIASGETGTSYQLQGEFSNFNLASGKKGSMYISAADMTNMIDIVSDGVYTFGVQTIGNNNMHLYSGLEPNQINSSLEVNNLSFKKIENKLPIAATVNINTKHQSVFSATKQLTASELDQLDNVPDAIFALADGTPLVDGFSLADCQNLYLGNEGKLAGKWLIDMKVNEPLPVEEFISTWRTTTDNESITIPAASGYSYDCEVDWGDGTVTNPAAWDDAGFTHEYAVAGDYEVKIDGVFESMRMSTAVSRLNLISVSNLGYTGWTSGYILFASASNMETFDCGACDTSGMIYTHNMFQNFTNMTATPILTTLDTSLSNNMSSMLRNWSNVINPPDLSNFDTSKVTNMSYMISGWVDMTSAPDLSSFDTSKVTNFQNMMASWTSMGEVGNIGVENFNIGSLTSAASFAAGSIFAQATMDLILINWEAQAHQLNVTVNFGNGNYTLGGAAETAYNNLVADGWSITNITGV